MSVIIIMIGQNWDLDAGQVSPFCNRIGLTPCDTANNIGSGIQLLKLKIEKVCSTESNGKTISKSWCHNAASNFALGTKKNSFKQFSLNEVPILAIIVR